MCVISSHTHTHTHTARWQSGFEALWAFLWFSWLSRCVWVGPPVSVREGPFCLCFVKQERTIDPHDPLPCRELPHLKIPRCSHAASDVGACKTQDCLEDGGVLYVCVCWGAEASTEGVGKDMGSFRWARAVLNTNGLIVCTPQMLMVHTQMWLFSSMEGLKFLAKNWQAGDVFSGLRRQPNRGKCNTELTYRRSIYSMCFK